MLWNVCALEVRATAHALEDEGALWIIAWFGAEVLNPVSPACAKKIETKAVFGRIHFFYEAGTKVRPLCRVNDALEYRKLHTLAEVLAKTRDPAQPPFSLWCFGTNVVGDSTIIAHLLFAAPDLVTSRSKADKRPCHRE